jgi:predicted MFS family arabinose efflux permease
MTLLPKRRAVIVFMVLALAYFLSSLIRAITATLAPTLVQELSLNAADLGLLAGGYFLGFSLTQLPLGTWLDRFGPKRVESYFLLVAIAGCIAFSMSSHFAGLLLARVLCGVGLSACLMAPLTGYRRWYAPATLMRANSWMLMAGALGTVASTLPVQWLLPLTGWRPIFWMLAAATALALLLIAWQVPTWTVAPCVAQDRGTPSADQPSYEEVWSSPYFRSLVPLGFFGYGGMVAMQTLWVTPWLVRVAGFSPTQSAAGLFWISLAMLVSYWLWGLATPRLAQRGWGANQLLLRGVPLSFVPLLALAWTGGNASEIAPWMWGLYCVLATVCTLAQPALGMAFRAELAGRALSAYNLVVFCGVFAVQWGVGLGIDALRGHGWTESHAYQGALTVYVLCYSLSYLHFLRAKKP